MKDFTFRKLIIHNTRELTPGRNHKFAAIVGKALGIVHINAIMIKHALLSKVILYLAITHWREAIYMHPLWKLLYFEMNPGTTPENRL